MESESDAVEAVRTDADGPLEDAHDGVCKFDVSVDLWCGAAAGSEVTFWWGPMQYRFQLAQKQDPKSSVTVKCNVSKLYAWKVGSFRVSDVEVKTPTSGKRPAAEDENQMGGGKKARNAGGTGGADDEVDEVAHEALQELFCPITYELPLDPVTAMDGKVYERDAILKWIDAKKSAGSGEEEIESPFTGLKIGTTLLPAPHIRNIIKALVTNGTFKGDSAERWLAAVEEREAYERSRREDAFEVKRVKERAALGDPEAQTLLGVFHWLGYYGFARDQAKAKAIFKDVVDKQSYPDAQYWYGYSLIRMGTEDEVITGLIQLAAAAGAGCEVACNHLGIFYETGVDGLLIPNRQEAKLWYARMGWCRRPDSTFSFRMRTSICNEEQRRRARDVLANSPLRSDRQS